MSDPLALLLVRLRPAGFLLRHHVVGQRPPITNRDYKGTFTVSYKQVNKGRLFNFQEGSDPKYRFEFPDSDTAINTNTLSDIDDVLLNIFMRRVEELG